MADNLDNFGAGVFDDPPAQESADSGGIALSEREIAIAKGEDPNDQPEEVVDELQDEQAEESEVEATEESELAANESLQSEEEPEQEEVQQDVFSLGDRKLAARYGLSEEDIAKFGSPEALHHALDVLDRTKSTQEQSSSNDSQDSAESPVEDSAEDAAAKSQSGTLSELLGFEKLDVTKYENAEEPYDQETLDLVKHIRKTEDMLEKITGVMVEAESSKNAELFHDVLDKYPDVYGMSLKDGVAVQLDDSYEKARQAVRDQAETIYAGIVSRKGDVPPLNQIIEQAIMAVHGKEIGSQASSKPDKSEKLKKQSSKRRSPGSSSASSRRQAEEIDPSSAGSIAKHPDIEAMWRKAQEANGAV